jgi:hypothetical protein
MPEPFVAQLGRISGKLLSANLVRDGYDLEFSNTGSGTSLLYLDVNTNKIGINTIPVAELDINGTTNVRDSVIVDGSYAIFDNLRINTTNTITSTVGPIIIAPTGAEAYVEYGKVLNTDLEVKDNYISATTLNSNITLDANGAGKVVLQGNTSITGDLSIFSGNITATGNVLLKGTFTIGDSPIDTITVVPDFTQSIVPGDDSLYDLGAVGKYWRNVFLNDLSYVGTVTTTAVTISDQTLYTGNTISTLQSNDDLIIESATGNVTVESLTINQGTITNLENTPVTLSHTGSGYLKITDESGFGIPSGDISERVGNEVGDTRWNNEIGYMECFDGTVWQVATGGGTVVTAAVMEDFGNIYTLIFG